MPSLWVNGFLITIEETNKELVLFVESKGKQVLEIAAETKEELFSEAEKHLSIDTMNVIKRFLKW